LNPDAVADWLAAKRQRGMSAQTSNHYLTRLRSFGRWLVKRHRLATNPFEDVATVEVAPDRRHERGTLSHAEIDALVAAARPRAAAA
jgi:site-specific recombinase XerC